MTFLKTISFITVICQAYTSLTTFISCGVISKRISNPAKKIFQKYRGSNDKEHFPQSKVSLPSKHGILHLQNL